MSDQLVMFPTIFMNFHQTSDEYFTLTDDGIRYCRIEDKVDTYSTEQ